MKLREYIAFGKLMSLQIMDPLFINIRWRMRHFMFWKEYFPFHMEIKMQRWIKDNSFMSQEVSFILIKILADSLGKLLVIITPPRFEKFFEEIGIPIIDKSSFQPPQVTSTMIENIIKTAARFGLEIKT